MCLAPAAAQGGFIQNNLYSNMVYFEGAYFVPFFKKFIYLFYFWQCLVFIAAGGLSLVAASEGYSLSPYMGFSLRWHLLLWSTGSRHVGSVVLGHRT